MIGSDLETTFHKKGIALINLDHLNIPAVSTKNETSHFHPSKRRSFVQKFNFFLYCALGVGITIFSCNKTTNSNNSMVPNGSLEETETFSTSGNTIVIYVPAGSSNSCDTNTYVESSADTLTTKYEFSGNDNNMLRIINASSLDTFYDTNNAMVVTQGYYTDFTRVGAGSGLDGVWKIDSVTNLFYSGTINPGEIYTDDNGNTGYLTPVFYPFTVEYQFSGNNFSIYLGGSPAAHVIFWWESYWSLDFSEVASKINDTTVKLVCNLTGDIINVTCNGYTIPPNYTVSCTGQTTWPIYSNPTPPECPNECPWFDSILVKNESPASSVAKQIALGKTTETISSTGEMAFLKKVMHARAHSIIR